MPCDPRPIKAKRPTGSKWQLLSPFQNGGAWERRGVRVLSTIDQAKLPRTDLIGPQWHVSISNGGKFRPMQAEVDRALQDFNMVGAEEDNHHPGVARHFWMPIDPAFRVDCECKEDEVLVTERDGYKWTNDPKACRGCELARKVPARTCPIHPEVPDA
jgi:hypothetical protein